MKTFIVFYKDGQSILGSDGTIRVDGRLRQPGWDELARKHQWNQRFIRVMDAYKVIRGESLLSAIPIHKGILKPLITVSVSQPPPEVTPPPPKQLSVFLNQAIDSLLYARDAKNVVINMSLWYRELEDKCYVCAGGAYIAYMHNAFHHELKITPIIRWAGEHESKDDEYWRQLMHILNSLRRGYLPTEGELLHFTETFKKPKDIGYFVASMLMSNEVIGAKDHLRLTNDEYPEGYPTSKRSIEALIAYLTTIRDLAVKAEAPPIITIEQTNEH